MGLDEKSWAKALGTRLSSDLSKYSLQGSTIDVTDGRRLAYKCEVLGYSSDDRPEPELSKYETDLLLSDKNSEGHWVPRVVIECKLKINTHDALTYSAKAATHKNVHPYLRYGILVCGLERALPGRLVKHGAYFDFMLSWKQQEPTAKEWGHYCELLGEELKASRLLQSLFVSNRSRSRKQYHLMHRKLVLAHSV